MSCPVPGPNLGATLFPPTSTGWSTLPARPSGALGAVSLGKEKLGLFTALTFPHFKETGRGEYITEEQSIAIRDGFLAKKGRDVKAYIFRLAYLLGIRKGQLQRTHKRNVLIQGDTWRLRWAPQEHKGGKKTGKPHEVVLTGEALDIVQRAWAARRPDCDFLFHIDGQPVGRCFPS